jgi:hypothetical protein
MVPTVFFGNYPIPAADLDLTGLPAQIKAVLNPPANPTAPNAPRVGRRLGIRVRVNGAESKTWRPNAVTGVPEPDPAVTFLVT